MAILIEGIHDLIADQNVADIAAFPTRQQIANALDQITTDRATLAGTPTNAQVVQILGRTLQNEAAMIQVLRALVQRAS